ETTVGGGERVSDPHPDTFRASDAGRDESGRVAAERHGGGEGESQFVYPAAGEETAEHLRPALEGDRPGAEAAHALSHGGPGRARAAHVHRRTPPPGRAHP